MVTHTEIEITVTKFRIALLKVMFPGGHHLVVGGRLVSEAKEGKIIPHPDLPEYRRDMFPVPVDKWGDGDCPEVTVTVRRDGKMVPCGVVRSGTLLFTPRDARAIKDWIRSQQ